MRQTSTVAVLWLVLHGCAEPASPVERHPAAIVNGKPTAGSPASVLLKGKGCDGDRGFCSGTLISRRVVLTAAHCILGEAAEISVFFGEDEAGPGKVIQAGRILPHPELELDPNAVEKTHADIGLIALREPAPATPVPPFAGDLAAQVGAPVHLVGFGATALDKDDLGRKREGLTKLQRVEGDWMVTGYEGATNCVGDSGGSNYLTIAGVEYVAGVTSHNNDESVPSVCGRPEDRAIRTDTYIAWIRAFVAEHETGICAADGRCNPACPDMPAADPDCPLPPPRDAGAGSCEQGGVGATNPDAAPFSRPRDGGAANPDAVLVSPPRDGGAAEADAAVGVAGSGGGCSVAHLGSTGGWMGVLALGLVVLARRRWRGSN